MSRPGRRQFPPLRQRVWRRRQSRKLRPPEEPRFEPAPVAETADAEPPPSAEPAIEVAELGALPAETPVVADDVAVEPAIVEEPPVEEPAPEVAVDAAASDHDIGAQSVSAEPVEPPIVDDAGIVELAPAAEPATHAALNSTSEPAAELPPPCPSRPRCPRFRKSLSRPLSKSRRRSWHQQSPAQSHHRLLAHAKHRLSPRPRRRSMRRRPFRRRSPNHLARAGASGCAAHYSRSLERRWATPRLFSS